MWINIFEKKYEIFKILEIIKHTHKVMNGTWAYTVFKNWNYYRNFEIINALFFSKNNLKSQWQCIATIIFEIFLIHINVEKSNPNLFLLKTHFISWGKYCLTGPRFRSGFFPYLIFLQNFFFLYLKTLNFLVLTLGCFFF